MALEGRGFRGLEAPDDVTGISDQLAHTAVTSLRGRKLASGQDSRVWADLLSSVFGGDTGPVLILAIQLSAEANSRCPRDAHKKSMLELWLYQCFCKTTILRFAVYRRPFAAPHRGDWAENLSVGDIECTLRSASLKCQKLVRYRNQTMRLNSQIVTLDEINHVELLPAVTKYCLASSIRCPHVNDLRCQMSSSTFLI